MTRLDACSALSSSRDMRKRLQQQREHDMVYIRGRPSCCIRFNLAVPGKQPDSACSKPGPEKV